VSLTKNTNATYKHAFGTVQTYETCALYDINGFLQHNNNGRLETLFRAKRIRCSSLHCQLKLKPCIKTYSESKCVDPVLGASSCSDLWSIFISLCVFYVIPTLKTETASSSSRGSILTYQPTRQYVLEEHLHRLFTDN